MKNQDFLPFRHRSIISLWDMIQFALEDFNSLDRRLSHFLKLCETEAQKSDQKGVLTPEHKKGLLLLLNNVKFQSQKLELPNAAHIVWQIQNDFYHPNAAPFYQSLATQVRALWNAMSADMTGKKFAYIPKDVENYFEDGSLFGVEVANEFLNAQEDIKNAGNCLAAGLNTAAVFHLMRASEFALKKAAKKLRVKTKHEIDLADWGEILKGIKKKLDVLELKKRTRQNEAQLVFYNSILEDLKGIKHLWRNPVMHARGEYNRNEALAAFGRVRDLMQTLALAVQPKPDKKPQVRTVLSS